MSEVEIKQSKAELLDCIQNLMGVFDTPISRFKLRGEFVDEVREIGRNILKDNRRGNIYDQP